MIVCHTQQTMADLEAVVGVPPDKVTVIPHPVGDAVHSLGPQATRAQARYRLNLPSDGDLVLFFGAIRPYKNLPLILKAWRTIEARLDRAYLVIAGRSETWSTDGALIEQLGLERVIARPRWIPPSEVPLYFAASDLTALPYNHIDASGVAAQAAGFRCPMLISDIPGFRAFWHEDEARFVPPDESAWAAAVIETLTSIDRGHSMARRALARASRELTWSTSAQRHIEVYREAQQRWHHRSRGA
jgi:glycosyltransferase involved in cell wall biosynthesis